MQLCVFSCMILSNIFLKNKYIFVFTLCRYQRSTSSTNFVNHVIKNHRKLYNENISKGKLTKIDHALSATGSQENLNKSKHRVSEQKSAWGRKLSLWVAEALIPAEVAVSDGTKRFLKSLHIDTSHFPTDRTILTSGLRDVYLRALETVKNTINAECPNVCCISTDFWTDSHIGLSYVNYDLIYFHHIPNKIAELKTLLLETTHFEEKKTGVNLCADLKRVILRFNLENKCIVLLEDGAANNCICFREIREDPDLKVVLQVICINHNLHNLLYTDVFNSKHYKNTNLNDLIKKLKKIHRKVYYKKVQIQLIIQKNYSSEIWSKVLVMPKHNCEENFENLIEIEKEIESQQQQQNLHLKKNNTTRWNSTLKMLKSFMDLVEVINELLLKVKEFDLMISEEEFNQMKDLISIFSIFDEAVTTFQASLLLLNLYFTLAKMLVILCFVYRREIIPPRA